eukprot:g4552.t1
MYLLLFVAFTFFQLYTVVEGSHGRFFALSWKPVKDHCEQGDQTCDVIVTHKFAYYNCQGEGIGGTCNYVPSSCPSNNPVTCNPDNYYYVIIQSNQSVVANHSMQYSVLCEANVQSCTDADIQNQVYKTVSNGTGLTPALPATYVKYFTEGRYALYSGTFRLRIKNAHSPSSTISDSLEITLTRSICCTMGYCSNDTRRVNRKCIMNFDSAYTVAKAKIVKPFANEIGAPSLSAFPVSIAYQASPWLEAVDTDLSESKELKFRFTSESDMDAYTPQSGRNLNQLTTLGQVTRFPSSYSNGLNVNNAFFPPGGDETSSGSTTFHWPTTTATTATKTGLYLVGITAEVKDTGSESSIQYVMDLKERPKYCTGTCFAPSLNFSVSPLPKCNRTCSVDNDCTNCPGVKCSAAVGPTLKVIYDSTVLPEGQNIRVNLCGSISFKVQQDRKSVANDEFPSNVTKIETLQMPSGATFQETSGSMRLGENTTVGEAPYMTFAWTPTKNDVGSHTVCFIAYDCDSQAQFKNSGKRRCVTISIEDRDISLSAMDVGASIQACQSNVSLSIIDGAKQHGFQTNIQAYYCPMPTSYDTTKAVCSSVLSDLNNGCKEISNFNQNRTCSADGTCVYSWNVPGDETFSNLKYRIFYKSSLICQGCVFSPEFSLTKPASPFSLITPTAADVCSGGGVGATVWRTGCAAKLMYACSGTCESNKTTVELLKCPTSGACSAVTMPSATQTTSNNVVTSSMTIPSSFVTGTYMFRLKYQCKQDLEGARYTVAAWPADTLKVTVPTTVHQCVETSFTVESNVDLGQHEATFNQSGATDVKTDVIISTGGLNGVGSGVAKHVYWASGDAKITVNPGVGSSCLAPVEKTFKVASWGPSDSGTLVKSHGIAFKSPPAQMQSCGKYTISWSAPTASLREAYIKAKAGMKAKMCPGTANAANSWSGCTDLCTLRTDKICTTTSAAISSDVLQSFLSTSNVKVVLVSTLTSGNKHSPEQSCVPPIFHNVQLVSSSDSEKFSFDPSSATQVEHCKAHTIKFIRPASMSDTASLVILKCNAGQACSTACAEDKVVTGAEKLETSSFDMLIDKTYKKGDKICLMVKATSVGSQCVAPAVSELTVKEWVTDDLKLLIPAKANEPIPKCVLKSLSWDFNSRLENVRLDLFDEQGTVIDRLVTKTDVKFKRVSVDENTSPGSYTLKLQAVHTTAAECTTPATLPVQVVANTIALTRPSTGTKLYRGCTYDIKWSAPTQNIGGVSVKLCKKGTTTCTSITSGTFGEMKSWGPGVEKQNDQYVIASGQYELKVISDIYQSEKCVNVAKIDVEVKDREKDWEGVSGCYDTIANNTVVDSGLTVYEMALIIVPVAAVALVVTGVSYMYYKKNKKMAQRGLEEIDRRDAAMVKSKNTLLDLAREDDEDLMDVDDMFGTTALGEAVATDTGRHKRIAGLEKEVRKLKYQLETLTGSGGEVNQPRKAPGRTRKAMGFGQQEAFCRALADIVLPTFIKICSCSIFFMIAIDLVHAYCPNACSGHDCSLRTCPGWKAWSDSPNNTDTAHADYTECSNMGHCDRATGECQCEIGFFGNACQYMVCPGFLGPYRVECSGHGKCVSMKEAAEQKNGFSLVRETTYTDIWDSDMIRGCACDYGWEGFDCSLRKCPTGDDPLTTGQLNEIQVVECRCPGACSGNFSLSVFGQTTKSLSPQSPAASVKTALEELSRVREVEVKLYGGVMVCDSDGVDIQIEFLKNPGALVPITANIDTLAGSLGSASLTVVTGGTAGNNGAATVLGTRENAECSNRGDCDHRTGVCTCSDGFSSSDGGTNEGKTGDCSYTTQNAAATNCPTVAGVGICNLQGTCDDTTKTCTCNSDYKGGDCSIKVCSMGRAWFDEATAPNVAHANGIECSNMGLCDPERGKCVCDPRMTGDSCSKLKCPTGNPGAGWASDQVCGGERGQCVTLETLALSAESNGEVAGYEYGTTDEMVVWDWDSVQGCSCSRQGIAAAGYDCSKEACPTGDDPMTFGVDEVQEINCAATSGTFYLRFRDAVTAGISYSASAVTVQAALQSIEKLGSVTVEYLKGNGTPDDVDEFCDSSDINAKRRITFLTEHGDLPFIKVFDSETKALKRGVNAETVKYFKASGKNIDGNSAAFTWTSKTLSECETLCDAESTCNAFTRAHDLADTATGSCYGWSTTSADFENDGDTNVFVKSVITEIIRGTKEEAECSNRGICDSSTGRCNCFEGFSSSNGMNDRGIRGDCSFIEPMKPGIMSKKN